MPARREKYSCYIEKDFLALKLKCLQTYFFVKSKSSKARMGLHVSIYGMSAWAMPIALQLFLLRQS